MRLFATDRFPLPLPAGHPFPAAKYGLLRNRVEAAGGRVEVAPAASEAELERVHDAGYVRRVLRGRLAASEQRRLGFPWSDALVERARRSAGATIAAARAALEEGVAAHLGGGTHHAHADRGAGYCIFNDLAVAARAMQSEGRVERVLVADLDVHHGDGTASLFADDPTVFTLSVHGARNYPRRKPAGDLDVALPDGTGDDAYLAALEPALDRALAEARPDLALYVAGADPLRGDRFGRLALTKAGLRRRDALALGLLADAGVPVAVTLGGGYARPVTHVVDVHLATLEVAAGLLAGRPSRARAGAAGRPPCLRGP